jgi:hypothetical protein
VGGEKTKRALFFFPSLVGGGSFGLMGKVGNFFFFGRTAVFRG